MDFKKCSRCGNFYLSEGNVCPKCIEKDNFEFSKFKSYINQNGLDCNLDSISQKTEISIKNINRFLGYECFDKLSNGIKNIKNTGNLNNNKFDL